MHASSGAGEYKNVNYKGKKKNVNLDEIPPEVLAELVGDSHSTREWKGAFIAILVICSISGIIAIAVYATREVKNDVELGPPISLTDSLTWRRELVRYHPGVFQWSSDGSAFYYKNFTSKNIMAVVLGISNVSVTTLFTENQFSKGAISQFYISPDNSLLLIPFVILKEFRHSYVSQYMAIQVPSSSNVSHTVHNAVGPAGNKGSEQLQLAAWGQKGVFLVFVFDNNLYFTPDPMSAVPIQITHSNDPDIQYGLADWVYEEEILFTNRAFWVSPDNSRIAYLTFNSSRVRQFNMEMFGSEKNLYPSYRKLYYPKPGTENPVVTVHVYVVETRQTLTLSPPSSLPKEYYVSLVKPYNTTHFIVGWMDRAQQMGILSICGDKCATIFKDTVTFGWMELTKQNCIEPLMDPVGQRIFTILHNSNNRRIVEIRVTGLNQLRWLSPVGYDVTDLLHWSPNQKRLFFLSCRLRTDDSYDPKQLHVHYLDVTVEPKPAVCITCSDRTTCQFNKATFSPAGRYWFHECLGPEPYSYTLRQVSLPKFPVVWEVDTNAKFKSLFLNRHTPQTIFMDLKLKSKDVVLQAKLTVPEQLNDTHISQYPLVLKVYGGPSRQLVTKEYTFGWEDYLATSLFAVVASVDGRGTGNRGSDFLFAIKDSLANVELEDQLDALVELRTLKYINKTAVCIFGWSYGGFLTLHMLGHSRNANANPNNTLSRCGLVVAPVTDFSLYNTAYTERYLGLKTETSAEHYQRTSVYKLAPNLVNKDLLIAHGTGDDNVHYQNSALLAKSLVDAGVEFEFLTYPDEAHGLVNVRRHLFRKMTVHLLDSWNKTSERFKMLLSPLQHQMCLSGSVC